MRAGTIYLMTATSCRCVRERRACNWGSYRILNAQCRKLHISGRDCPIALKFASIFLLLRLLLDEQGKACVWSMVANQALPGSMPVNKGVSLLFSRVFRRHLPLALPPD